MTLMAHYERLAPRERQFIMVAGGLLAAALVWWWLIAPALQTWRSASSAHAQLDAQIAQMQTLAIEAKALKAAPRLSPAEAQGWLERSIKKLGKATLTQQGSRVQISFTGASAENLAAYLAEARTNAALLPLEAQWKRAANAKTDTAALWDGRLVFEVNP